MSWSLRLGRILGIDIYVHATFFLLPLYILVVEYSRTRDWHSAINQLLFVLMVFVIVVMHEYGHALMARRFGVKTRDITLLPIGGVARLERIPENPVQEFLIAVAGPAVNVVLAVACAPFLRWSLDVDPDVFHNFFSRSLVAKLFYINVMLVLFNLIPAFPMDGGRVLRSILAMNMNYVRATQIAARVGQMFALLLGILGLFASPMLLLIAFFVWVGAAQEANMVATRATLAGLRVADAMMSTYRTVSPHDTLEMVAQHILAGFQQDFPVVDGDRVVGIITRSDMLAALARVDRTTTVSDVMQRQFAMARPEEMLIDVLPRLQSCQCNAMPVLSGDRLVGLISAENVGELMMIRAAHQHSREVV